MDDGCYLLGSVGPQPGDGETRERYKTIDVAT